MLDLNKILKIYNDLEWELVKLQDVSNLTSWGYFESLLSNIDWHIYFLYRIRNKPYFDYFLLDKHFWEQAIKEKVIEKNEISLKNYNYIDWFKTFDKLKNNEDFIKYFYNYKSQKLESILNKQEILKFSQIIKILQHLKKYKPQLEIDFFDFDINDYDNFSKSWFTTEKSIVSDFLRKSAIYDFDFEKFYLLKREELDKKISLGEWKINDFYHDLWILNTYYRFYKLYKNLIDLSYFKIILLKIANAGNIFDENKKYLQSLLIFHFAKNKDETRKINFIFKNSFVEFTMLVWVILVLLFWNISFFITLLVFTLLFFAIFKLIILFIDKFSSLNSIKIIFSIIILTYSIFSLFVNPITISFMQALPQKWLITFVFQDKKIKKEELEKSIREKFVDLYKQLNNLKLQSDVYNK